MRRHLSAFAHDDRGATAIEYSMIAAGIAGAVMVAISTLGSTVQTNFYGKIVGNWQ
ncbi:Flp family type IVb pilin [Phreatobacter aquaticus]|uniref:Flp family type IVb pilin n=2 Tax=Phreatobacter aquaticus TaxID=2570229 RepID=A0A4D7QTN9_9HYPH|nr:Flp family type IVb pilin [Phreatobacter aquaticus]